MPMELHTHIYRDQTSVKNGHVHYYSGRTSPSPDVPGHTHRMPGQTTVSDGHTHQYALITGPGIASGIGHRHYYRGETGYAQGHDHMMEGYTSVD